MEGLTRGYYCPLVLSDSSTELTWCWMPTGRRGRYTGKGGAESQNCQSNGLSPEKSYLDVRDEETRGTQRSRDRPSQEMEIVTLKRWEELGRE